MFDIKSVQAPSEPWRVRIAIDAMYLHAARQAFERALAAEDEITVAQARWKDLVETESAIREKYEGDSHAAYDELEPIYMQMEDAKYQIGAAHAPRLKECAAVHILVTGALEAHINTLGEKVLHGKEYDQFERWTLESKWLFLPKVMGLGGFKVGHQPYQGFAKLLKYRNALVHYKGLSEPWIYGAVPKFVEQLGLTMPDAESAIATTEAMIFNLAVQRGTEPPFWLKKEVNSMDYFKLMTTSN